ncbi:MAG: YggT family protein [Ascidiaceihabitans sp.]|jgi:YggT family protein
MPRTRHDLAAGLRFIVTLLNCVVSRLKDVTMLAIYGPLQLILGIVYTVMIVHIIMSWLINFQVLNLHQPLVSQIWNGINRLLEPIYEPLRRILPDTRPLDLAPLVALIVIISLRAYILPVIFGFA